MGGFSQSITLEHDLAMLDHQQSGDFVRPHEFRSVPIRALILILHLGIPALNDQREHLWAALDDPSGKYFLDISITDALLRRGPEQEPSLRRQCLTAERGSGSRDGAEQRHLGKLRGCRAGVSNHQAPWHFCRPVARIDHRGWRHATGCDATSKLAKLRCNFWRPAV